MKSSKLFLIIATVLMFAALGLSIAKNMDNRKDTDNRKHQEQNFVVSDTIMPQAKLPVLKIGGKENADVYLQSLDVQVEVTGNIASTRYTMVFKNKTGRILEGELTFPLPDGRTVTHYALDINGVMRDAVPVEKAKATQVFEEIEQRQVDPGLLERVEGNNFRTRIYPIPANGIRTVSIGYEEELSLEKGLLYYRLPMAYPDSIEKFAVKATVWKSDEKPLVPASEDEIQFDRAGENYVASFARENYQPARALVFALPAPDEIPQVMVQSAQGSYYFLASVTPNVDARKKQWDSDLAIVWDVSLSGSQRDFKKEFEALNTIFGEKKNAKIHLYFLNNRLTKKGDFQADNGNWSNLKNALETAVYDGGTDFAKINLNTVLGNEILFFSDGISTLSDADFLTNNNVSRPIHCFVSSAKADYSAMKLIAGKTRGKFLNLNTLSSNNLKNELLNETLQFLGTEHENAVREVYPSIAAAVQGNFSLAGISDRNKTELTLLFGFGNKVEKRIKVKIDAENKGNIYRIWAQKKIAELDLNYEKNRAELTELGQQFGIVTRNTSLIVLETVDDYIRYNIAPPAELQAEYQRRQKGREEQLRDTERNMLNEAVAAAEMLKKWWDTDFTPKKPKYPIPDKGTATQNTLPQIVANVADYEASETRSQESSTDAESELYLFDIQEGMATIDNNVSAMERSEVSMNVSSFSDKQKEITNSTPQPIIKLKPIKKDNDYLNKLTGKTADDYQIYLKLRTEYANSPTFYFDMADWFYRHNDRETALRILTSIADLELENASLYRLLGYRLKEYGEYALEKFVCRKLIVWRPMEPQSYRDYALALADNGQPQTALDSLYALLTKPYSTTIGNRSRGTEEVVVTEINHLIAKNANLDISKIDKRLIINIPIDIRVVINWNMNNTDIDLHVKDPNREECYYSHQTTQIGGRISNDNTSGYGPEQFLLKKAVKGKYRVFVNYYGDRQFTAAGPSTIMAEIFTKYADKTEHREVVCLQMSNVKDKDGKVEVAEFEF